MGRDRDPNPADKNSGTPQTFSGSLAPPSACRGPWVKVVMDYTVSVSGRQYDRIGDLNIGGTEVWWGTTEEPSGPTPITYTVSKDLTEYSALLHTAQPFKGGIGNYTSDVYTGNYDQTVTLTYYPGHAPRDLPDAVVGFPGQDLTSSANAAHLPLKNLPLNITRAYLEVTLEGHGCDEQWFSDVPADVAARYPSAGLCQHGPYREADVSLDGTPVAAVHTFPHIYTGGIVPTLWRPIPAIHTFSLTAERVDVTPFVGRLVDGGAHDLGFTVQNNGDSWTVVATLLLYTDHRAAQTHGALTENTTAPATTERITESGDRVTDTVSRHDVTAGYVDTSAGRVHTRVVRTVAYRNDDTVTANGLAQHIVQHDSGTQASTVDGRVAARHAYEYPITIDYSAAELCRRPELQPDRHRRHDPGAQRLGNRLVRRERPLLRHPVADGRRDVRVGRPLDVVLRRPGPCAVPGQQPRPDHAGRRPLGGNWRGRRPAPAP